jgi:hypothetical protein
MPLERASPRLLGTNTRARGPACPGRNPWSFDFERVGHDLRDAPACVVPIATATSRSFSTHNQLPGAREATGKALEQTFSLIIAERATESDAPSKSDTGVRLVYVLASRAGRPAGRFRNLVVGNHQARTDLEALLAHGSNPLIAELADRIDLGFSLGADHPLYRPPPVWVGGKREEGE